MKLSESDKQLLLKEREGPIEYFIFCGIHSYFGGLQVPPTAGCQKCQQVYFIQRYLEMPPSYRKEFVDELDGLIHRSIEAHERGEFDLTLYRHPKVEIQRDASDEEIKKLKE